VEEGIFWVCMGLIITACLSYTAQGNSYPLSYCQLSLVCPKSETTPLPCETASGAARTALQQRSVRVMCGVFVHVAGGFFPCTARTICSLVDYARFNLGSRICLALGYTVERMNRQILDAP
jgi:hypothetical protein